MKKLLSILAAVGLTASASTAVVACGSSSNGLSKEGQAVQDNSLDMAKSLVVAKQYGIDVTAINNDAKIKANADFDPVNHFQAQDLGLTSTTGLNDTTIYKIVDALNTVITKFGGSPLEPDDSTISTVGTVLSYVSTFITEKNVNGLINMLPGALKLIGPNLKGILQKILHAPDIDPDGLGLGWLGGLITKNFQYILSGLDFNATIARMISNAKDKTKTTIGWFMEQASESFKDLTNHLFSKYVSSDNNSSDLAVSKFLGQEIFTKLLNGQKIDVSNSFDYLHLGIFSIDMIDDVLNILATLSLQINAYAPASAPKDAQHLYGDGSATNDDYFKTADAQLVSVAKDGSLTLGQNNTPFSISMDKTLGTIFSDITSNDQTQFGILKLTTTLFHSMGKDEKGNTIPNPYLEDITYTLIDSLKFTDYKVVVNGSPMDEGPITFTPKMSFNLEDLFKPNTKDTMISLGDASMSGNPLGTLEIKVNNKGLLDIVPQIVNALDYVLSGATYDSTKVQAIITGVIGTDMDKSSICVNAAGISLGYMISDSEIWAKLEPMVKPYAENLLFNIYYGYDEANSIKNLLYPVTLKDGKPVDDKSKANQAKIDEIEKRLGGEKFTGANFISWNTSHFSIGSLKDIDLNIAMKLISFDTLNKVLKAILMDNPIQDDDVQNGPESFIQQILGHLDDTGSWAKYLGFVDASEVDKNITSGSPKWTSGNTYIYSDSILGDTLTYLYELDTNTDNKSAAVVTDSASTKDPKATAINTTALDDLKSDKIDALVGVLDNINKTTTGEDVSSIVTPLFSDNKVWSVSNTSCTTFKDDSAVKSMTYYVTLDPTSLTIKDASGNEIKTDKTKYKITFSRDSDTTKFKFNDIEVAK